MVKKVTYIALLMICILALAGCAEKETEVVLSEQEKYDLAQEFFQEENYEGALAYLYEIEDYEDSVSLTYEIAENRIQAGDLYGALTIFERMSLYHTEAKSLAENCLLALRVKNGSTIATNGDYVAMVLNDGTVDHNFGEIHNREDWTDLVAVSVGLNHMVGLKADGTVVGAGNNEDDKADLSDWENMVQVVAGDYFTLGLTDDGHVLFKGDKLWSSKLDVLNSHFVTKLYTTNDTVFATTRYGDIIAIQGIDFSLHESIEVDNTGYTSIYGGEKQLAVANTHVVALNEDGTVKGFGSNEEWQLEGLSQWKDIVAVAAGSNGFTLFGKTLSFSAGLKKDGTVVAEGNHMDIVDDVTSWQDIAAIATGPDATNLIGLKKDGTLVGAGNFGLDYVFLTCYKNVRLPMDIQSMDDLRNLKDRLEGHSEDTNSSNGYPQFAPERVGSGDLTYDQLGYYNALFNPMGLSMYYGDEAGEFNKMVEADLLASGCTLNPFPYFLTYATYDNVEAMDLGALVYYMPTDSSVERSDADSDQIMEGPDFAERISAEKVEYCLQVAANLSLSDFDNYGFAHYGTYQDQLYFYTFATDVKWEEFFTAGTVDGDTITLYSDTRELTLKQTNGTLLVQSYKESWYDGGNDYDDFSYDYLYPSDSQYITSGELDWYTQEEITILRNEIYARHGYNFSNEELRNYFNSQPWYYPVDGLNYATFDQSVFNDIEKTNLEAIVAYEAQMGW